MPTQYDDVLNQGVRVGDAVTATTTWMNQAGVIADPTTLSFSVKAPSGATATYTYPDDTEISKTATGIYVLTFTVSESGNYRVRAHGTGAVQKEVLGLITVPDDPFS